MSFFKPEEFECQCGCGTGEMDADFLTRLNNLREAADFPFIITSGMRCETHNEAIGGHPNSAHKQGKAVDIAADHVNAMSIIESATAFGFNGVGVKQKGSGRFIHLDIAHEKFKLWSY